MYNIHRGINKTHSSMEDVQFSIIAHNMCEQVTGNRWKFPLTHVYLKPVAPMIRKTDDEEC